MEPYSDFSITLYGYRCKLLSGDLPLKEHTEKRWVTPKEMNEMDFAKADEELIKKVFEN